MEAKTDLTYKIHKVSKDADTLYNNGKVLEAFLLAEIGNITVLETVEGQQYVISKVEVFNDLLENVAEKSNTKIEYINSEGINPQVDGDNAIVQGE